MNDDSSTPSTASRPVPFEEAIAELEQVVKGLESGDLSLDDAIDRFQRGMHLVKVCREQLQVAEQKVELV
ncbi:MAG: exodeoxyribonuclease VII small subunit, partial [Firmicutes bacterium]|nr:exodeoxyribonuclease VII small subunit [Bacillota bacterium]